MGRGRSIRPNVSKEERRARDPWDHLGWEKWEQLPGALQCAVYRAWLFSVPTTEEERLRLHFAIATEGIHDCLAVQHEEPRWMVTHLKAILRHRIRLEQNLPGILRLSLALFFNCKERVLRSRLEEDRDRWQGVRNVVQEVLQEPELVRAHLARLTDDPGPRHWKAFARGDWRIVAGLGGYPVDCEGRFVCRRAVRADGKPDLHRLYLLMRQLPSALRLPPDEADSAGMARSIGSYSPSAIEGLPDHTLPFNDSEKLPWAEYDSEFEGRGLMIPDQCHGTVASK